MNFLINTFLTESKEQTVGSFIGGSIKPKNISQFQSLTANGIILSKKINDFKEQHPSYLSSKQRLNPKFSKYSDEIIDVFYDHLLAANWNQYSSIPLESFINKLYQDLIEFHALLPYKISRLMPVIISENLLGRIERVDGLHKYMRVLTKKENFQSSFDYALIDLTEKYSMFKEDFHNFMPDLIEFIHIEMEKMKNAPDIYTENLKMYA